MRYTDRPVQENNHHRRYSCDDRVTLCHPVSSTFKMTSSSSPILPSNDVGPVGTLLFFSLLMIVCPISTFFIVRSTLVHFATDMLTSSIAAAVCSILAVHGVVAMFVYKAYHEKDDGPSPALVDKDSKVPQKID